MTSVHFKMIKVLFSAATLLALFERKEAKYSKRAWHAILFFRLFFSVNALFERLRARDARKMREKNTGPGITCECRTWWVNGVCCIRRNFGNSQITIWILSSSSLSHWMTWKAWVHLLCETLVCICISLYHIFYLVDHRRNDDCVSQVYAKGHSADFKYEVQLTRHEECYSAWEKSCIMPSVPFKGAF